MLRPSEEPLRPPPGLSPIGRRRLFRRSRTHKMSRSNRIPPTDELAEAGPELRVQSLDCIQIPGSKALFLGQFFSGALLDIDCQPSVAFLLVRFFFVDWAFVPHV